MSLIRMKSEAKRALRSVMNGFFPDRRVLEPCWYRISGARNRMIFVVPFLVILCLPKVTVHIHPNTNSIF
jgi:hypothetical protein